MAGADHFGEKLTLVLKALSISRGRLAAEVGVDKSVVGRWAAGAVTPSGHNLERLTHFVAGRSPGFSLLDWDRDVAALAARLGVEAVTAPATPQPGDVPSGMAEWLQLPALRHAATSSGPSSNALAGYWRTTRPSPEFPGKFLHDHVIMQPTRDGPLRFRIGLFSSRLSGWSIAVGDQMYCCATNMLLGSSIFAVFNRVHRPRIDVLDGVTLACMADAGGSAVAGACLLNRVGNLSGDDAEDEAAYEELLAINPIAADDSVPAAIKAHLLRDFGPAAMAQGGDPILTMRSMRSLASGGAIDAPLPPLWPSFRD